MSNRSRNPASRANHRNGSKDAVVGASKPRLLGVLGPGLITGASDDDPSGIATYSQAGAQLGFSIQWLMLFSYPLMCAVQEISARLGRTTERGIAGNLRQHYPNWLLQSVVLLLAIANIINLGADLGAMGDVAQMLTGMPRLLFVVFFAVLCATLQIFMTYTRYVAVLKWTTLSLLFYFGTVMTVRIPWGEVARGFFIPKLTWSNDFLTIVTAVLGTTISPYLFFWQSSQEAEDERVKPYRHPLVKAPSAVEPLSSPKFPANREKNREFCEIPISGAPQTANTAVFTGLPIRIPYTIEQGIISGEQGIWAYEQGISAPGS